MIPSLFSLSSCAKDEKAKDKDDDEQIDERDDRRPLSENIDYNRIKYATPSMREQEPDEALVNEAREVGNSGDLKITLLWDFPGDIDLHVVQPSGREICYLAKTDSESGGSLDVDNRAGGAGSAENIFWQNPPSGQYNVYIHYYQPSSATREEGSGYCNVVLMRKDHQPVTFRAPMSSVGQRADIASFVIN